jgi:hypothetical protein
VIVLLREVFSLCTVMVSQRGRSPRLSRRLWRRLSQREWFGPSSIATCAWVKGLTVTGALPLTGPASAGPASSAAAAANAIVSFLIVFSSDVQTKINAKPGPRFRAIGANPYVAREMLWEIRLLYGNAAANHGMPRTCTLR